MSSESSPPEAPPPPPMISNPDHNEGPRILGATVTATALALIVIVFRCYVRVFLIRSFGVDDAVMCFAMLCCLVGIGIVIAQVHHGAGRHRGDIDPDVFVTGLMLNFITQPLYLWVICIVKLAVGFSLLRIATEKFYRILIISIMTFMGLYTLACFLTIMFQCTNIKIQWDPTVEATCWTIETLQGLAYTNVACNIFTDLLFAIVIPVPMLWKLRMNKRTKLGLLGILSLGVFATAAACVKVPYIVNYGRVGDFLWDSRDITIWTIVEANIGIIAGSLPALKPLFKTVLGSYYARGTYGQSGAASYGKSKQSQNWSQLRSRSDHKDLATDEAYIMDAQFAGRQGKGMVGTTTEVGRGNSDDSLERYIEGRSPQPRVIVKTTEASVRYEER